MEQDEEPIDIPLSHSTIRQNDVFVGKMVEKMRSGKWTENDLRLFLEGYAYRTETINRFVRAVKIRLEHHTGTSSSVVLKPKKPKRSEGAMTPEEVEKIDDLEARRLAKEYLDETEAPSTEADTASSASVVGTSTAKTAKGSAKAAPKKRAARHDDHR